MHDSGDFGLLITAAKDAADDAGNHRDYRGRYVHVGRGLIYGIGALALANRQVRRRHPPQGVTADVCRLRSSSARRDRSHHAATDLDPALLRQGHPHQAIHANQGEQVKKFGTWLAGRKKAIAGLVAPGAALFVLDVADGSWPTEHEWSAILLACVVGAIGVYIAPKNAD